MRSVAALLSNCSFMENGFGLQRKLFGRNALRNTSSTERQGDSKTKNNKAKLFSSTEKKTNHASEIRKSGKNLHLCNINIYILFIFWIITFLLLTQRTQPATNSFYFKIRCEIASRKQTYSTAGRPYVPMLYTPIFIVKQAENVIKVTSHTTVVFTKNIFFSKSMQDHRNKSCIDLESSELLLL